MKHDDLLGEAVPVDEAEMVQQCLMIQILGEKHTHDSLYYPGSQPVSLARDNLGLLQERRYWVPALPWLHRQR